MFTHEELMEWLAAAVQLGSVYGNDTFRVVPEVDGDVLELDIEYWTDDNQTENPTDKAKLRLRIE